MEPFRLSWQRPPSGPSRQSTLLDTLPASWQPLGACVTGASGLGHIGPCRRETAPPSRLRLPIPADPCMVLRITLALEPRFALTPESSQNPFRRMHVRYVA